VPTIERNVSWWAASCPRIAREGGGIPTTQRERLTARGAHRRGSTSSPLPRGNGRVYRHAMGESKQETTGMRVVFWTWLVLIFGGLAVMIVLPLLGR